MSLKTQKVIREMENISATIKVLRKLLDGFKQATCNLATSLLKTMFCN